MKQSNMEYSKTSEWGELTSPNYYTKGVKCIDIMLQQFGVEYVQHFCLLNAFKYIFRCTKKHDTPVDDIKKAMWYLEKYLQYENGIYETNSIPE